MNKSNHIRDVESTKELAKEWSKKLNAPVIPASVTKKPYYKGWQELTRAKSVTAKALSGFSEKYPNIAVVLGNGLITIDCDDDEFMNEMFQLNPFLRNTLISQGSENGCNFWLRLRGADPGSKRLRMFREGTTIQVGEWRSKGNCTIISGYHAESGRNYSVIGKEPLTIHFSDLKWPKGLSPFNPEVTIVKDAFTDEDRRDGIDTDDVIQGPFATITSIEQAVELCTPVRGRSTDSLMFKYARALKAFELHRGSRLNDHELKQAFRAWYQAALPFLRDQPESRYWLEFLHRFDQAKTPLGHGRLLARALQRADSEPAPKEAMQFSDDAMMMRLISLLYYMQIEAGDTSFWLSTRRCGEILGISHAQAARWLKQLTSPHFRLLQIVTPHTPSMCPRFRWIGSLPEDPVKQGTSGKKAVP